MVPHSISINRSCRVESLFLDVKSQAFQTCLYMFFELLSHLWPPISKSPQASKQCLCAEVSQYVCLFNECLLQFLARHLLPSLFSFKAQCRVRILTGDLDVRHLPPSQKDDVLIASTQCICQ